MEEITKKRTLLTGWIVMWIPHKTNPLEALHVSARKGNMRVQKDGEEAFLAYQHLPFKKLGVFRTSAEGMKRCEEYNATTTQDSTANGFSGVFTDSDFTL